MSGKLGRNPFEKKTKPQADASTQIKTSPEDLPVEHSAETGPVPVFPTISPLENLVLQAVTRIPARGLELAERARSFFESACSKQP